MLIDYAGLVPCQISFFLRTAQTGVTSVASSSLQILDFLWICRVLALFLVARPRATVPLLPSSNGKNLFVAALVLGFVLTALVVWRVLLPFLLPVLGENAQDAGGSQLATEKERLVQVLRDLEIDYQTGKVSLSDYQHMKQSFSRELAEVLIHLDKAAHV